MNNIFLTAAPSTNALPGFLGLPDWVLALAIGIVVVVAIIAYLVSREPDDFKVTAKIDNENDINVRVNNTVGVNVNGPVDVNGTIDHRHTFENATPTRNTRSRKAAKKEPTDVVIYDNPSREKPYEGPMTPSEESKELERLDYGTPVIDPFKPTTEDQIRAKLRNDPPEQVKKVISDDESDGSNSEPEVILLPAPQPITAGELAERIVAGMDKDKVSTYVEFKKAFAKAWEADPDHVGLAYPSTRSIAARYGAYKHTQAAEERAELKADLGLSM